LQDLVARKAKQSDATYREIDSIFRSEYLHAARIVNGVKVSGFRQPLDSIEVYLNRALDHFSDKRLSSITFADVQQYRRRIADLPTMHGRQRSVSDINHHLSWLRRIFNVAIERGLLNETPFKRGSSLINRAGETERARILSRDEEVRLLAACKSPSRRRLRQMIIIAIETGLRRGEITSLGWQDINLDDKFLVVTSSNSKTLRSRIVPLSNRALQVFQEIKGETIARFDRLIFGKSNPKKAFRAACRDAGISGLRFHDLRHTAITRWLEAGISPTLAMKASGHSQFRTFLRYVNPDVDTVREFAARLNATG
jgi:integrase